MTRARDNAFNPFNNQVAGKNAVINGGMDIWQRGTTFAGNGAFASSFTADRWQVYRGGASGASTATRGASDLPGFKYFIRVQRPAGDTTTTYLGLWQSLESANSYVYAGKTVTLSFYARAGSGMTNSFGLGVALYSGTGIDEPWYSHTGSTTVGSSNFTLTTTGGIVNGWQRFSVTGNVPSNSNELGITFGYNPTASTASSTDYYDITGVQLELGSTPTVFSRAGGTIGGELALCQRYYYRVIGTNYTAIGSGFCFNATNFRTVINFPTFMRSAPGVAYSGSLVANINGGNVIPTGINGVFNSTGYGCSCLFVDWAVSGQAAGYNGAFYTQNSSLNYVEFSAEL